MTSALSAAARHLRIVDESASEEPAAIREAAAREADDGDAPPPGEQTPVVGYVVLVPEGTDVTDLFTADGTRARFRPLLPSEQPPAPPAEHPPAQHRSAAPPHVQHAHVQHAHVERPAAGGPAVQAEPYGSEGVHVNPERHTAHVDGRQLDLTYLEFELLAHFVANPHRVHSRAHLVGALWGYSHVGDGRTVDVHIARLRRKLGRFRDTIVTVRRVGYKYEPGRAR
ncbi:winged helix-turn-helix domain-containing protein [Streptomyces marispadix]|uniref:Winged helix-turn-helix domain-containing protein n=1 Tax=Streptomyces marispadix TaxID=2922868 RepID=A0ABS9T439_9ACTN|nr:winged helix-turn-helix domain-containing protein [Streptomyces marispadix]MCH6163228.1 winged helix-turn-helix domain-containing protein [Streptomyces marispadix]